MHIKTKEVTKRFIFNIIKHAFRRFDNGLYKYIYTRDVGKHAILF